MKRLVFYSFILYIIICLIFQNCRESSISKLDFPIEVDLKSTSISIPVKVYGKLSSVIIYNDLLLCIEPFSDSIYSVFKLPSCSFIGSFGTNGRGPNEFNQPAASNTSLYENGIVSYDLSDRFFKIDLSEYITNKTVKVSNIKLPGEISMLNNGFMLNDSIIIGKPYVGGKDNSPFVRYNINSGKVESFGIWPDIYPVDREKLFWSIYSGRSRVKPDQSMFATFVFKVKMFQIYKSNGDLYKEKIIETQEDFFENEWIRPYPIQYYTCVRATDSYIYALNVACPGPKMPENIPTLEIWDWEARPIAKISLDIPVNQFDISKDGKFMYCIDWNTMDKIFLYDLTRIFD